MYQSKWDIRHAGPPQTVHPRSHFEISTVGPGINAIGPGINAIGPGTNTIDPGSPYKKMPIRLNSYEKILSLIGYDMW